MDADRCVMCGDIIPEGIMVCPLCDRKIEEMGKNHPQRVAAEKAGMVQEKKTKRFRLIRFGRKEAVHG